MRKGYHAFFLYRTIRRCRRCRSCNILPQLVPIHGSFLVLNQIRFVCSSHLQQRRTNIHWEYIGIRYTRSIRRAKVFIQPTTSHELSNSHSTFKPGKFATSQGIVVVHRLTIVHTTVIGREENNRVVPLSGILDCLHGGTKQIIQKSNVSVRCQTKIGWFRRWFDLAILKVIRQFVAVLFVVGFWIRHGCVHGCRCKKLKKAALVVIVGTNLVRRLVHEIQINVFGRCAGTCFASNEFLLWRHFPIWLALKIWTQLRKSKQVCVCFFERENIHTNKHAHKTL
mmetsp:Transcript_10580/g.16143  ORF Transcript_10580/g.16143 Transcript_10580/m.16143 type:complete len:282 (-) Transcript_10580:60-905(-)